MAQPAGRLQRDAPAFSIGGVDRAVENHQIPAPNGKALRGVVNVETMQESDIARPVDLHAIGAAGNFERAIRPPVRQQSVSDRDQAAPGREFRAGEPDRRRSQIESAAPSSPRMVAFPAKTSEAPPLISIVPPGLLPRT